MGTPPLQDGFDQPDDVQHLLVRFQHTGCQWQWCARWDELSELLKPQLGRAPTADEIKVFMLSADVDKNGALDLNEYLTWVSTHCTALCFSSPESLWSPLTLWS